MITDEALLEGERLLVPERVVVAPVAGRFEPDAPACVTTEGELVREGQSLGRIVGPGSSIDVRSVFRGFLMGMLVHPGERVREGQPVAWLRTI